jgi:hypothetical protein
MELLDLLHGTKVEDIAKMGKHNEMIVLSKDETVLSALKV